MASPGMTYFGLTGDNLVDATTNGYKWVLGPDRTLDWSISGGLQGEFWNNSAAVATQVGQMLSVISAYANVKFNYVGSFTSPQAAAAAGSEIDYTMSGTGLMFSSSNTWAEGFFPNPNQQVLYTGEQGDIFLNLNSQANYLPSYSIGSAGWALMMHETFHTLGLKHPHDSGGTGRPTLDSLVGTPLDKDWVTVMSYNDDYQWNLIAWEPATPMLLDVLALQYLYGPNMSTGAGDTTWQLSRLNAYATVWDASGNDTVSAAGQTEGWLIVMPSLQLSSLISTKAGLAAPLADYYLPSPTTLIWLAGDLENVVGSSAADVIAGNQFNNRIQGGYGNDVIDGDTGIDTAVFSGTPSQYTIARNPDGSVTLTGPDGSDTLINVERLDFGSYHIAIDISGDGGEAYRLYQAAFNRMPDLGGLGYQINALDNGLSLSQVAANFIASPEFQATYGSVNNTQFITLLYKNVLHRAPDTSGLQFHLNELASGQSRADELVHFSESPENQANVIGTIQNGILYTP